MTTRALASATLPACCTTASILWLGTPALACCAPNVSLTLRSVYSSSFSDWFSQAVIDYALGSRTLTVFTEFLRNLASTDPRELLRISKVREAAVETCTARVLNEGERLLSGWSLFSPVDLNTRMSDRFEEKVVLLVRYPHVQHDGQQLTTRHRPRKPSMLSATTTTSRR